MTRYDRRARALAICLSALAGYVDAIAFIKLGGFFVSFMSGNSTRLGVGVAEALDDAAIAGGLILAFVGGVTVGALAGHIGGRHRPAVVMTVVGLLLAVAGIAAAMGGTAAAVGAMAVAMGVENAVFVRQGEVRIGLTYMTGSLVRLGQGLAAALLGEGRRDWLPYLLLWIGFVAGAAAGAAAYPAFGLSALWAACLGSFGLAALFARMPLSD